MKTAIAIDSLLFRDESTFLIELILNLFPDSEFYTIAHKQGAILGSIETRPIVSSFLAHRAENAKVFEKNFWIMPSAVKNIPLHPSIEKVMVISRGYIHGLSLPDHVTRYLYILDWSLVNQRHLGWQKLFSPYVNDWREKALTKYPKIAVSSETLKENLELPNAEVIAPTYRTEEYPFVKDEDHNFLFTHHLIYTHDLSREEFKKIVSYLLSQNEMIRVLGPDKHLKDVLPENTQLEFGGDHCEATCAMYSHQAKAIWVLSQDFFPSKALGGLATGRPVIVRDLKINREFLTQGAYFLKDSQEDLKRVHAEVDASYLAFDRRVLRRLGLKWNERLFKSRMVKFFERSL
jgi:hypothetical protein